MGKKKDAARAAAAEQLDTLASVKGLAEARAAAAATPLPKAKKVPLFVPDGEGVEHLRKHHGIDVADPRPQLVTAIHQADHFAAGVGGRPLVVRHYHTADVARKADE